MQLLKACNFLWWKSFHSKEAVEMGRTLVCEAVAAVEAYLPCTELDIKLHNLVHLVDKILMVGPLWVTSMFPYESMNHTLVSMAKSPHHPEVSSIHSYAVYELAMLEQAERGGIMGDRAYSILEQDPDKDFVCYRPVGNPCKPSMEITTSTIGSSENLVVLTDDEMYELHLLYMKQSDDYADMFNDFLQDVYERAGEMGTRDTCGVERVGRGYKYNKSDFGSKLLVPWQVHIPFDIEDWEERQYAQTICQNQMKLDRLALRHTKVLVNGVEFRPSVKCSRTTQYYSWFLALHDGDTSNPYYAGHIRDIIEHRPPWEARPNRHPHEPILIQGIHIARVEWHAGSVKHGAHVVDPVMSCPVVEKAVFDDQRNGPLWNCAAIAPIRFTVVKHYSNNRQLLLLHRDPRSIWEANITVPLEAILAGCVTNTHRV
jgi:hypothetical protein